MDISEMFGAKVPGPPTLKDKVVRCGPVAPVKDPDILKEVSPVLSVDDPLLNPPLNNPPVNPGSPAVINLTDGFV